MTTTSETLNEAIRVERRDGAAVLWLDVPGKSVNTLRSETEAELDRALDLIHADAAIEVVVIASAKPAGFMAGADVGMLRAVESAGQATELSRGAQAIMDRIASFRAPTVAAIHGHCLGGGLELALACRGRVASDEPSTRLGLPEVKLGLIPGAGGTQRLPRLVGLEDALMMILSGRALTARQALDIGLVDELVHPAIVVEAAIEQAKKQAQGADPGRGHDEVLADRLRALVTEGTPLGRWVMYRQARRRTSAKTHGNMPAPMRAIEVMREGLTSGVDAGLRAEAEAFGELAVSSEARHLMALFVAREQLKSELGVSEDVTPRQVDKVGVVGAGLMGSGIAYRSAAEAGLHVRLSDLEREQLRKGLRSVHELLDDRVGKGLIDERERELVLARVHPTTRGDGFGRADVVIEAVAEDLGVKRQVLRDAEARGPEHMIFASNTSAIPIADIAEAAARPRNVVGMHYFSPVDKIPLLEVVRAPRSSPEAVATAVELGKRQGLTVIVVNDGPGFYTSRVLARYLAEAAALLADGAAIDAIDEALEDAGFPVGPFQLMDEVGLDVAAGVARTLDESLSDRIAMPEVLARVVGDDRMGRKNDRGFYRYEAGERVDHEVDPAIYELIGVRKPGKMDPERVSRRCLAAFANEAAWCYGDGVVRSIRDADVGAVLGLGFPAHLGGPMTMIDERGCEEFVAELIGLRSEHGGRFEPAPVLTELMHRGVGMREQGAPGAGWHRERES